MNKVILLLFLFIFIFGFVSPCHAGNVTIWQTNVWELPTYYPKDFSLSTTYINRASWVQIPYGTTGDFNITSGTFVIETDFFYYFHNYIPDQAYYEGPRWIQKVNMLSGTTVIGNSMEQYQSLAYIGCDSDNDCRGWNADSIIINENTVNRVNITWTDTNLKLNVVFYNDKPYAKISAVDTGSPSTAKRYIRFHEHIPFVLAPSISGTTNDWAFMNGDYQLASTADQETYNILAESGQSAGKFMFATGTGLTSRNNPFFITWNSTPFAQPVITTYYSPGTPSIRIGSEGGYLGAPGTSDVVYIGVLNTENSIQYESPNVVRVAGAWYNSSKIPPFNGIYRMSIAIGYDETLGASSTGGITGKNYRHKWYSTTITNNQFRMQVPVSGTVYHVIYYPWNRTEASSTTNLTLMDIYNMIWGTWESTNPLSNPSESFSNTLKESEPTVCFQSYPSGSSDCLNYNYFMVGNNSYGKRWRTLLDFNTTFPNDIDSGNVNFVLADTYSALRNNSVTVEVHNANVDWLTHGASWNKKNYVDNWANAGGDWIDSLGVTNGNTPFCSFNVTVNASIGTSYSCNITSVLQTNYSHVKLFVKASNTNEATANDFIRFHSFRDSLSPYVPNINYTNVTVATPPQHTYGEGGDSWTGNYSGVNVSNQYNPSGYIELTSPIHTLFKESIPDNWWWRNAAGYTFLTDYMRFNTTSAAWDLYGTTTTAPTLMINHTMGISDWSITKKLSVNTMSGVYDTNAIVIWANSSSFLWGGLQYCCTTELYPSHRTIILLSQNNTASPLYTRYEISNSSTTYWLRITKAGTTYTISYSTDGISFTNAVSKTWTGTSTAYGISVFGGTTGSWNEYSFQSNDYNPSGNLTWWENTTTGHVAYSVDISLTSSGLPYNMYYANDGSTWTYLGQYSGTFQTITIPSATRYQNTTLRMEFLYTEGNTPSLKSATTHFSAAVTPNPEITTWSNTKTLNTNTSFSMTNAENVTFSITPSGTYDTAYWFYDDVQQINITGNSFILNPEEIGSHVVRVYLVNNNPSLFSNTVSWTIDVTSSNIQYIPASVTNLVSTSGNTWINLSWADGSGVNNSDYYIISGDDGSESETEQTYVNLTGLSTRTSVNYTVIAVNTSGEISYSDGVTIFEETHYFHDTNSLTSVNLTLFSGANMTFKTRAYNSTYDIYSAWNETTVQLEYESVQAAFTQIIMDWWE